MTAIDREGDGYNLSKHAMNTLTYVDFFYPSPLSNPFADACCSDNEAEWLGMVDATSVQVPNSLCGLN